MDRNNLNQLFETKPRGGFALDIYKFIKQEEIKILNRRRRVTFVFSSLSFLSIIPAIFYMIRQFSESNFYTYLSLMFSSGNSFVTYWKEFSFVLTESFPIFAVSLVLVTMFIFVTSVLSVAKNSQRYFSIINLS